MEQSVKSWLWQLGGIRVFIEDRMLFFYLRAQKGSPGSYAGGMAGAA